MPEQVHDCVRNVLDDNPTMPESRAWAICNEQIDAEAVEIGTLTELDVDAEALDELAAGADEWTAVEGGWLNTTDQLAVYDPDALGAGAPSREQTDGLAVDVFQVTQPEDSDLELDGDCMGIGIDFPNAGVYVDWHIDAWPDDEQLEDPHVSDYGTVEDLEQATEGVVDVLKTVTPRDDATASDRPDKLLVVNDLSEEAIEDLRRRYNAELESFED